MEKSNNKVKMIIVYLGLTVLLCAVLIPKLKKVWIERERQVEIVNTNIYSKNFGEDFKNIEEVLNISSELKVKEFQIDYEKDGRMKWGRYVLVEEAKNKNIVYNVSLKGNKYVIHPQIFDDNKYENLVSEKEYLACLNSIDFNALRQEKEYEY